MADDGSESEDWSEHGRGILIDPRTGDFNLHLQGLHYDDKYHPKTQPNHRNTLPKLEHQIESDINRESTNHVDARAVNPAAFLMVTLQRRIEGLPLPLDTRDMTVPQAGRRGGSVGEISTFNGQIGLTRLSGSLGNSGIAISLGIQRPPNT